MTSPERWQRIEELCHAALARQALDRAAFLTAACGTDEALRQDVEALLEHAPAAEQFLASPMGELAARVLVVDEPSLVGQQVGAYEVLSRLGAGGMGEVYRARDPRLRRDVAIKVLPQAFMADPERRARFESEARLLAALNHPNVGAIYGVEDAEGVRSLVLELVEGPTLADRLMAGPLPLEQALNLARQIAAALEAAHEKGIVHRDLKPANIKITPSGTVKVLDFGIAKAGADRGARLDRSDLTGNTQDGLIMGTAPYMSPEQARGTAVDERADVWAFGCVLYEMLTACQAFSGKTGPDTIAAVLAHQPDWTRLPAATPASIRQLLDRCLEKETARRPGAIGDVRVELDNALAVSTRKTSYMMVGVLGGIALVGLLLGGLIMGRIRSTRVSDPSAWVPITDFTDAATQPALSLDGRLLTFIRGPGSFATAGQVYVKLLPDGEPAALTHDAAVKMSPMFTPDGTSITYTVAPTWDTWMVSVVGGPPRLMLPNASGLTWIDTHRILFSEIGRGRHMRVVTAASSRSEVRDVYEPPHDVGMAHRSYLSPAGSRVLVAEMDAGRWLPCRLVPFDGSSRGAPVGPPRLGCTSAAWSPEGRWMFFVATSATGAHIWRQQFPDGTPEQLTSGPSEEDGIAMAPDGHSFVTSVGAEQNTVWIHTASGDRQITSEGSAFLPDRDDFIAGSVFSPDGKKLYYLARPRLASGTTSQELWMADLDQGRSERALPGVRVAGYDISPDGQRVVYAAPDATRGSRVWVAQLDRAVPPRPLGSSSTSESRPVYGPGGSVFFQATESGAGFVYRMREDGTERVRVSPTSIIEFLGVSPDGQWVVAQVPLSGEKTPRGTVAYSVRDGSSRRVCYGFCLPSWSPDGRSFNVALSQIGQPSRDIYRTLVIPLQPGQMFPPLPPAGIRSETDVAELKGASIVDGNIYMSLHRATYAFQRPSVHRNLYRVPVP